MKYLIVLMLLIGCGGGSSTETVISVDKVEIKEFVRPSYTITKISENNYYLEVDSDYEYSFFIGTVGSFDTDSHFEYFRDTDALIRMYYFMDGDWVLNIDERISL